MTLEKKSKSATRSSAKPLSSGQVAGPTANGLVKKITVYKNGDLYHQGIKAVVNPRQVHDLDVFLAALSPKMDLAFGVKKLFTTSGKVIKEIGQLDDGQAYVASSAFFTPMPYGGKKTIVRPSRSVEPLRQPTRAKRPASISVTKESTKASKAVLPPVPVKPKKKKKIVKKKSADPVETKISKPPTPVVEVTPPRSSRSIQRTPSREKESLPHSPDPAKSTPSDLEKDKQSSEGEEEIRSVSRYAERPMSSSVSHKSSRETSAVYVTESEGRHTPEEELPSDEEEVLSTHSHETIEDEEEKKEHPEKEKESETEIMTVKEG